MKDTKYRIQDTKYKIQDREYRIQDKEYRIQKNWIKATEYSKHITSLRYKMYFIRYMFTRPEDFQTKNLFIQRENI